MNEQFEFFYGGPFSQWYPSIFKSRERGLGGYDFGIIEFVCAEQYMMFCKAALFGDHGTAALILMTDNPKEHKRLGRGVIGFDPDAWNSKARDIVYRGNMLKFSQNAKLYEKLMETGDKILVEASPFDTIWGIGLNEADAKTTPQSEWKGTNWLGEVLTKVKTDLRETYAKHHYATSYRVEQDIFCA